jgi:hypothetical protein
MSSREKTYTMAIEIQDADGAETRFFGGLTEAGVASMRQVAKANTPKGAQVLIRVNED